MEPTMIPNPTATTTRTPTTANAIDEPSRRIFEARSVIAAVRWRERSSGDSRRRRAASGSAATYPAVEPEAVSSTARSTAVSASKSITRGLYRPTPNVSGAMERLSASTSRTIIAVTGLALAAVHLQSAVRLRSSPRLVLIEAVVPLVLALAVAGVGGALREDRLAPRSRPTGCSAGRSSGRCR